MKHSTLADEFAKYEKIFGQIRKLDSWNSKGNNRCIIYYTHTI